MKAIQFEAPVSVDLKISVEVAKTDMADKSGGHHTKIVPLFTIFWDGEGLPTRRIRNVTPTQKTIEVYL